MNLLFVNSTRRWGGVKSWTLRAAAGLQARGHQVWVAGRRGDPFLEACAQAGLSILPVAFGMSWSPARILQFHRVLGRQQVDLVVGNTGRDLSTAGVAARLRGLPVVHRVGAGRDFPDTWIRRTTHRWMVRHMLIPSQAARAELLAHYRWIHPEEVAVSWNALEPGVPPTGERHPRRLACLSRLAEGKGLDVLLDALEELARRGVEFHLDLMGDGPLRPVLEARAATPVLAGRVTFHGFVRPPRPALLPASIGVMPSPSESFAQVLLDYWDAGLAVVASDLACVREVAGGDAPLLRVPAGDSQALAALLARLLAEPGRVAELAAAGRSRLVEAFHPAREAERLERLFLELVGRRPRSEA